MEELRIQHLARSAILVETPFSDLALHFDFHRAHSFIHRRPCDILSYLIPRDGQVYAERLRNSEHEPMADLPVTDRFAVFQAARVHPRRQPLATRRILISQQCDKLCSFDRTTKSQPIGSASGPDAWLFHQ